MHTGLVPPELHPGRSPPLALQSPQVLSGTRPRSHSGCLCVTAAGTGHERWHSALPMSRLQRQDAVPDANAHPRDPNPSQVGAFLPPSSLDTEAQVPCLPRDCPQQAQLTLCCPMSVGLSFMEKLGMGLRRKSRDALDLPYAWGTEDSSLSLSSLAEDQHGRTRSPMKSCTRCTGSVMSASACTQKAGSKQRKRGELPQQPRVGSQPHHRLGEQGLGSSAALPGTPWLDSVCPHSFSLFSFFFFFFLSFPRPWELLVCTSCAVQGTHRHCSSLSESITSWECDICAGVGTGKRQTAVYCWLGARQGLAAGPQSGFARVPLPLDGWEPRPPWGCRVIRLTFLPLLTASSDEPQLAGPSTASQEAEGPSPSSPEPGNHRSDSTSKAASESPCGSQLPKRSSLSSQPRTGQSKSRGHTSKQHQGHQGSSPTPAPGAESSPRGSTSKREVGSSRNCPAAERRRQSGQQDTGRTRSRSPLKDRASNSPSQLRRNPGSRRSAASATVSGRRTAASATVSGRRTPAPGAESSTHTSGSRRASRNSPGAGSIRCHKEQGTSRRQSQSSLQGPASNSSSQPRGRRGSRLSAESGSQSSGRQVTSRSSRDSALPEHRRHSQNQERSRSPRDRRASNSPRQSGGSQSRSPRQRRPSQARRHSQNQP